MLSVHVHVAWCKWLAAAVSRYQQLLYMLQGILSDGRPLLMAVAPAASVSVKAAAICAMAAGFEAALQPSGLVTMLLKDEDMLPWQAFQSMTYMVSPN